MPSPEKFYGTPLAFSTFPGSGGAAACGNFAERTAMQFVLLKAHWQIKLI